jgi:hypothetical protein
MHNASHPTSRLIAIAGADLLPGLALALLRLARS